MFDSKTGQIVGEMKAYPEDVYDKFRQFSPNKDSYRSFYIQRLFAYEKNKGIGKSFINIAKKESFRNFCFGNLHVISSARFAMDNPPHIFYRKMGFSFGRNYSCSEKYIDECIKNNKQVEKGKCPLDIPMYIENNIDINEKTWDRYCNLKSKFSYLF